MCFYLIADIILDVLSLIALIFRILQKLLRLPFAFWRTLVEWNQSIQRGIRHLLMPRINANGDIFNAPVPNHIPGTLRRRTLRIAPVNGTWNETTGTTPSFVVTHYDDDSNNDDLHGTERGVEGSLAASVDELIAAEGQRSEQGAQEQEPHQPRPPQLGQQPLGQQRPEPLGHELQQLGPQQQSSELSPREPMPRERVLPQQDSGEPSGPVQLVGFHDVVRLTASTSAPMPNSGQLRANPLPIHFGPNGIQPRGYASSRLPGYPEPLPSQLTQGRDIMMPGTFPARSAYGGRERNIEEH